MSENVREVLEAAWLAIHHEGYAPENERDTCRQCDRFKQLLFVEAYTEAALMLLEPFISKGWNGDISLNGLVRLRHPTNPKLDLTARDHCRIPLAITQAALAAKGTGDE